MPETGARPGAASAERQRPRFLPWSLSNKLLFLTVLFVMVAEVVIYIPSIANYRNGWLQDKLDRAALVVMASSAAAEGGLPPDLQASMLDSIGVEAISLVSGDWRWLIGPADMPSDAAVQQDLTSLRPLESVRSAFATLALRNERLIMVSGRPPPGIDRFEILLWESRLRAAMLVYSRNILLLSLAISMITASLVYAVLRFNIVRPMQRLSASIIAFSAAPESPDSVIAPSRRRDEIGAAEERLAEMQTALRDMLVQRRRLADLGLAVSKINHDLRNILASAQLFSDRLGSVQDPLVKRFAPKVVRAIDRAIGYTQSVLAYGQATEQPPRRQLLSLPRLVDDVADVLALAGGDKVQWENRVPPEVEVDADPEQLFRVLLNLCRNALDAVSDGDDPAVIRRVWVEGERQDNIAMVRVGDTGPGVPLTARANLFLPFQGSARRGGTGLGLAIAAEIIRAHGGDISLVEQSGAGAVFEITVPDRPAIPEPRRHAAAS